MSSMCRLCHEYYEQYPLQDGYHHLDEYTRMTALACAFPEGVFTSENWNCQSMRALREIAGEPYDKSPSYFHAFYRWDDNAGTIGVFPIPQEVAFADEKTPVGYIVMSWYKARGRTGQAWVMNEDDEPQRLTLATAEAILAHFHV